jgi:hypothetical protein
MGHRRTNTDLNDRRRQTTVLDGQSTQSKQLKAVIAAARDNSVRMAENKQSKAFKPSSFSNKAEFLKAR